MGGFASGVKPTRAMVRDRETRERMRYEMMASLRLLDEAYAREYPGMATGRVRGRAFGAIRNRPSFEPSMAL